MVPQVVILGAGPAGVALTQKLLADTTPNVAGLKVVLVGPSTHLYWNPSSVKGLIPGNVSDASIFSDIRQRFKNFPKEQFEFVVGKATAVDSKGNVVTVETADGSKTLSYDQLVVATGTHIPEGPPFKTLGSHQETMDKWHDLQAKVKSARSITIAGAGPTGVEIAGYLGAQYGKEKTIGLVIAGERVLPDLKPSVGKAAEKALSKMNVSLIRNAKVIDCEDGRVYLSTNKSFPTDVYIPVTGVRPNTSFLPSSVLDEKKHLKLEKTFQVSSLRNVWGVGDVGNMEGNRMARVEPQVLLLAANLDSVLTGADNAVREFMPWRGQKIFVQIGDNAGTGQWGGFRLFSFLGGFVKDKAMFGTLKNQASQ